MECMTCQALRGAVVLTNGPRVELDHYWHVEHCHPVETLGWLRVVLRRHARSLHELSGAEATAFGKWMTVLPKALHEVTGCESEYVMQFAEGDGFQHVHVHLVARHGDWNPGWKGPLVFSAFGTDEPVSSDRVAGLMEALADHLGTTTTPVIRVG